jgi:hypothetical protein
MNDAFSEVLVFKKGAFMLRGEGDMPLGIDKQCFPVYH